MLRWRARDRRRNGPGSFFPGATLDMNFAQSRYLGATPSSLTVTRASDGYAEDTSGVWSVFTSNAARITNKGLLVEEARTNSIRNNSMQGAVAGVIGSGGAAPTNWSLGSAVSGTTRQIIGVGTDQGIDYIDVRISGTAGATGAQSFFFDGYASATAAGTVGQTWTGSCFVKLISNSGAALVNATAIDEFDGAGAYLTGAQVGQTAATTGNFQRLTQTRTLTNASTARTTFDYRITITNGLAYDFTIRIGWPQLELGAFATSPIRTTSAAVTRAADAVSLTGGAFTGWFTNAAAFTWYFEGLSAGERIGLSAALLSADDGTASNRYAIFQEVGALPTAVSFRVSSGGAGTPPGNITSAYGGGVRKIALAGSVASGAAAVANGGTPTTAAPASMPALTTLQIGQNGGFITTGYIRRVAYIPSRLSNAELQAITT